MARPAPKPAAIARAAGVDVVRVGEGASIAVGALRLQVLWPAPGRAPAGIDPNDESLLLAARFGGWSALLTGDAEAEATHVDPGPIDLLKVAHHGSADAGLRALLDRSAPRDGADQRRRRQLLRPPRRRRRWRRSPSTASASCGPTPTATSGPSSAPPGATIGTERGDTGGRPGCAAVRP